MREVGHNLQQLRGSSVRLYLDICCLNRPFDNQGQERVRLESEALVYVLASIQGEKNRLIGSTILDYENSKNVNCDRQKRVRRILDLAKTYVEIGEKENRRAIAIAAMGFRANDAMHIACAESGKASCLLTTDDGLLKKGAKYTTSLAVAVCNPIDWVREKDNESGINNPE